MRHAGVHWPENAGGEHPSRDAIIALPGMAAACLICSPSARHHYNYIKMKRPNALVVWRAIPRAYENALPAQLGWNASKVAEECLNLWDEQTHTGVEWFCPLNELQFVKENGAPFPGYGKMAENLGRLRAELRKRFTALNQNVRLLFPAWVPSDDGDHIDDWAHEAMQWDALMLHCYGSALAQETRYLAYRNKFYNHRIFVGEYNGNHEGHDEREMLEMWAEIARSDPLFVGATYYIYETNNAGERDLSIWGNKDRLALFKDPPVVEATVPDDFPLPMYIPTTADIRTSIKEIAPEFGLWEHTLLALCIGESSKDHSKLDRWHRWTAEAMVAIANRDKATLQDILYRGKAVGTHDFSFGPAHQTYRWSPEYVQGSSLDPYDVDEMLRFRKMYIEDYRHALRVAANQLASKWMQYGPNELETLCRYNKPNVEGKDNANRGNYLNALKEATEILGAPTEDDVAEFKLGFKDLADKLGADVVGEAVTDETYFTPDVSLQFTSLGMMAYSKEANQTYFFEAVQD